MRKILQILLSLLFLFGIVLDVRAQLKDASGELAGIIREVEEFKPVDKDKYPLGRYTEELYKEKAGFAAKEIKKLDALDAGQLSETERISLELLKFTLREDVDDYRFEAYLNPILSDAGFHNNLTYRVRPLNNDKEVKKYLDLLRAVPRFVDDHIELLRKGLKKGISQPLVILKGYEKTYDDHIVDNPEDSFYYSPFKNLPDRFSKEKKDSLAGVAKKVVAESVTPQFKKIKRFFEEEYYSNTRTTLGVSETPNGREYYSNRIRYYTTLSLTAEEVHQKGLKEVARIRAEMEQIIKEVDFDGSFNDFLTWLRTDEQFYVKTPEALLKEARNIAKKIDGQLPKFFKTLPRKPYGVAPVPDAIAPKYTTGRYVGSSTDTEPGYYWVNTYQLESRPLYVLPSLTAHEAVPGHHLQISLNQELGDSIPKFRRNLYLSAYGEGWALYTEYLAREMGIYTTPYEDFGRLTYEMWRACRLVVDTGLHAKGWTREEAVDFLKKNTALSIHEINTEVDRYISWPGQALSYKIGELKIRELRKEAEKALGDTFNIREFHELILEQGTVTLPILEQRVKAYIKQKS
ncbi:DUF885 domain-containing protein [Sinomicrobium weinanense]|uniref:DUF885 domain-containing protein n=1 Tax=Sinomicrobium weinanense TaxID=2842200 RepID=A0A926JPL2_9FLAO|nr:DUF885 domain-containing protein [Sinomicrobium weinanense]MBC9794952.1 DUF885 domain-containing protein [Sinomicrobium weinanense]MBU3125187.1 DUF885 domain-containing protein [Sinomicrobium weinanense]